MTPKKIALLTDSSADLRWETAEENNIFFVPLRILCRDGEYLDGVDIRGTDVYQRLHAGELPQTSLPRVEDFAAKLHEIFEKGYDGVIAVMLSSGLSGTYNLARLVAEECKEQGRAMAAFDSLSGSLGLGMTVLQLAEDIKNGMGWEELTQHRAPQLIANTYPFFTLDTLEYLQKGGRIGKVTAMAGTMLQIKPILTFAEDGQLQSIAKVRGHQQVMKKLAELVQNRQGSAPALQSGGSQRRLTGGNGKAPGTGGVAAARLGAFLGRGDRRNSQRLHRGRCAGRRRSGFGLTSEIQAAPRRVIRAGCLYNKDRMRRKCLQSHRRCDTMISIGPHGGPWNRNRKWEERICWIFLTFWAPL